MKTKRKSKCSLLSYGIVTALLLLGGCVTTSPEYRQMEEFIKRAELSADRNNYESAVKEYMQAVVTAEDAAPDNVYTLKKSLAQTYIEWARSVYWKAKTEKSSDLFKKAILLCEKAVEVHPKYRIKCRRYISKFKKELKMIHDKNQTSVDTLLPDKKEKEYKIAILQKQGNTLRREKQYMLAKEKFEKILIIDPFNLEATRSIKKIMKTLAAIGKERREMDQTAKMTEVEWKNVEPIALKEEAMESARREAEAGVKLQNRLALIKIHKLAFKDTPLDKAMEKIEKTISKSLGTDFKFEYQGFKPSDPDCPQITFQGSDIPADGAIKAICDGLDMFPVYSNNKIIIEKKGDKLKR
jgi:tetratricopeptide (TPR) repeat protein